MDYSGLFDSCRFQHRLVLNDEDVLLSTVLWIGQEMFKANGEMTTDSDEDGNAREHQKNWGIKVIKPSR